MLLQISANLKVYTNILSPKVAFLLKGIQQSTIRIHYKRNKK